MAALAKNSRESGSASPGGGFGRMVRIPWYSAGQPGAQPSGTFSFRRSAGSELGAATVHSHSVAAECLGFLNILERTPPGQANPLSWRPFMKYMFFPKNFIAHYPNRYKTHPLPPSKSPLQTAYSRPAAVLPDTLYAYAYFPYALLPLTPWRRSARIPARG